MTVAIVDMIGQQSTDRRGLIYEEGGERVGTHRRVRVAEGFMAADCSHSSNDYQVS
jgi:hypothetical protein